MTEDEFCEIIDEARRVAIQTIGPGKTSDYVDYEVEKEVLRAVGAMSILDKLWFLYWQCQFWCKTHDWVLWDFLSMAFDNELMGDRSFSEFRQWFVYQGRKTIEAALANPDSLVPLLRNYPDKYCMIGGESAYDAVCALVYKAEEQQAETIKAMDPSLLPPDWAHPERPARKSVPEDELQKRFPIGYQEYVIEGKYVKEDWSIGLE